MRRNRLAAVDERVGGGQAGRIQAGRVRELPAGEIAAELDVKRPTISRHLAVLRQADLVTVSAVPERGPVDACKRRSA
jgi:DNA-binding transcriptional ArsR family regulator